MLKLDTRFSVLPALLFVMVLAGCYSERQGSVTGINRTSFVYSDDDGRSFGVDRITGGVVEAGERQPALILLVDEATRIGGQYSGPLAQFVRHFAVRGYTVVAIDYSRRADSSAATTTPLDRMVGGAAPHRRSVSDALNATAFVLGRAEEWNIDPQSLILVGSGEGADVALAAEYSLANGQPRARRHLPDDFRYAAIVAMGGDFSSRQATDRRWRTPPSPLLIFNASQSSRADLKRGGAADAPDPEAFYALAVQNDYPFWLVQVSGDDGVAEKAPLLGQYVQTETFIRHSLDGPRRLQVRNPLEINRMQLALGSLRADVVARFRPLP